MLYSTKGQFTVQLRLLELTACLLLIWPFSVTCPLILLAAILQLLNNNFISLSAIFTYSDVREEEDMMGESKQLSNPGKS